MRRRAEAVRIGKPDRFCSARGGKIMTKLTNAKFQKWASDCQVSDGRLALSFAVFRCERVLTYDLEKLRDLGQILDCWKGQPKRQCLTCDTWLNRATAPPALVLSTPLTTGSKYRGILIGVCAKCYRQSDGALIAVMRQRLFPDAQEWQPISQAGNA
jgi:hypothetical protein